MISESLRITARSWDDVNISVAGNSGSESDLRPVRRKIRIDLSAGRGRETARLSAATGYHPQVARILKSHRVATHRRVTQQARSLGSGDERNRETQYRCKDNLSHGRSIFRKNKSRMPVFCVNLCINSRASGAFGRRNLNTETQIPQRDSQRKSFRNSASARTE